MSREILEAVRVLEREKGISSERLMAALEDALLSAYKKTPGAAKYARVDMDPNSADFIVYELIIPAELDERLLSEVEVEEATVDPETGEMREPAEPELDPELLAQYSDQIDERDVPPELIRKLVEREVPEIADGLVEIQNAAREPGYRSKIAVVSHAGGVDPVGACVGPRGSRVRMVVSELRGEKIDIIPFNEEPARFIAKALSPARVREVLVDDESKQATVVVPDDQLSLAIGREGLNARLAGLPAHQALAGKGTDYVAGEPPEGAEPPIEDDDELVAADGELVAGGDLVDVDEAGSVIEAGSAESGSERGLDDDVESAEA